MKDDMNDEVLKPQKSREWLQHLKDESWNAELLVSTIAILGTSQLFKVINWTTNKFIDILPESQYMVGYFIVFFGLIAVSVLVSMFIIHFVLRAYWVGLVGLNSVFPDYSVKDSFYSELFTEKILTILPKLKDSVEKIDELCSVIFSVAFTFLFMYIYISIVGSAYLLLYNLLSVYLPHYVVLIPLVVFIGISILQIIVGTIANTKTFKKNDTIQILYFKLVKIVNIIMLGPLYRNILQVFMIFGSNFKKKKSMIALVAAFLILGVFVSVSQFFKSNIPYLLSTEIYCDETKTYAGYYESENGNIDFLLTPEIESDLIQSNTLKLFIPIFSHDKRMQQNIFGKYEADKSKTKEEQRKERRFYNLNCYRQSINICLNDERISPVFRKYFHPRTNQFGIICYIKLHGINDGENNIEISKVYNRDVKNKWSIPFQYISDSN